MVKPYILHLLTPAKNVSPLDGNDKEKSMLTANEVLGTCFLETRCQLLEIAATLDRLDRARARGGAVDETLADPRLAKIYQSLALLTQRETAPDRVERLLNLFSDLD